MGNNMAKSSSDVRSALSQLNGEIVTATPRIGIVLAAGHGKRIRSETSKMLHEIWGEPTVMRVSKAIQKGLDSPNQVIVVGIKGQEVAEATGRQLGRLFAYQENPVLGLPAGTGDAVRVALSTFSPSSQARDIYIFLGDMGLLTREVVTQFRHSFDRAACDMMVLTGNYSGPVEENYYGRIIRVPATDKTGAPSGKDEGKVIEIKEHKDILSLVEKQSYSVDYSDRTYAFSRNQLLETREINTGVFAFKEEALRHYIDEINTDNVQGELMLTDLVHIFNGHAKVVRASVAASEEEILAFNVKSVLRQMQSIARRWAYERLKDTITIADEEDFFIADEVIDQILAMDKDRGPLDIVLGKGVHIGPQVRLNSRVRIGDRSHLSGHIILGEDVHLGSSVELSTYPEQTLVLGDRVTVLNRNVIKGNLQIGEDSRIESGVILTGSSKNPMRIGRRVTIKGTSYLYGCQVDDEILIEHSVLKCQRIEQIRRRDGQIQPICYVLPQPEGLDSLTDL
jgi:bifunctional UDP-N-acetylglucosamine pyrophosphorylase/glucosamine-1-phosphate N-acetyltransferase